MSNPYDYGSGDHQTADHICVWLQVRVCGRGLSLRPIGCMPTLFVTQQRRCSCSCRLWRYISVMPLAFTFYVRHQEKIIQDDVIAPFLLLPVVISTLRVVRTAARLFAAATKECWTFSTGASGETSATGFLVIRCPSMPLFRCPKMSFALEPAMASSGQSSLSLDHSIGVLEDNFEVLGLESRVLGLGLEGRVLGIEACVLDSITARSIP